MPHLRVWQFRAAPGRDAEFEAAYGPGGAWARFFRLGDGYLGTELLRPAVDAGPWLTIDRWHTEADWQRFLDAHGDAYRELDRRLQPLCAEEAEIGDFESV